VDRISRCSLLLAGCALILLPIGVRNYTVGGEFVLNSSQFGPNFYIGNHPGANGTYEALIAGHGSWIDERADATRLAEQATGRSLTAGAVSRFWTTRALEFIHARPGEWLIQLGRKFALAFNAAEIADTESMTVWAEYSWLLRVLKPFDFGVLFSLAMFGAVVAAASWRRFWCLYAIAATYVASLVMFYVFSRYRFPIVPLLVLLAAGGFSQVADRSGSRRDVHRSWLAASAAAVLALAFAHLPLESARTSAVIHNANIAAMMARDPSRFDEAMRFYDRALSLDPTDPAAQFGVGTLLVRMERPGEAISYLRTALVTWPANAGLRYNLGAALTKVGQESEAAQQLDEAVRLDPEDADARVALGKALIALNQPERAVQQYRKGLSLQSNNVNGLVGLGVALVQTGQTNEAIAAFEHALEIDPNERVGPQQSGRHPREYRPHR
jgi:tetratricopeptide (TPR) repeat protein